MTTLRAILCLSLVIINLRPSHQIALTAISCSSNDVCLAADPNSECANDPGQTENGYCACKKNYIENESWVCTLKVLNSSCSDDSDCQEVHFAVCNENDKCECAPGYADYYDNDSCEKVLERPCVAGGGCHRFLAHTVCVLNDGFRCSCEELYIEEGDVCKTALREACSSDADCVNNGECDKKTDKCACSPGHEAVNGHCVAGSARLQYSMFSLGSSLVILTAVKYSV